MAANLINNTGGCLWLKSANGTVVQVAICGMAPLPANGNYQISASQIAPGNPLPLAPNVLIANVGGMTFNFAAQGSSINPFNLLPYGGSFVLGFFSYNVTPYIREMPSAASATPVQGTLTLPTTLALPTAPTLPTTPALPTAPALPTTPTLPTALTLPTTPTLPTAPALRRTPSPDHSSSASYVSWVTSLLLSLLFLFK